VCCLSSIYWQDTEPRCKLHSETSVSMTCDDRSEQQEKDQGVLLTNRSHTSWSLLLASHTISSFGLSHTKERKMYVWMLSSTSGVHNICISKMADSHPRDVCLVQINTRSSSASTCVHFPGAGSRLVKGRGWCLRRNTASIYRRSERI
jgi:hypothetical protein